MDYIKLQKNIIFNEDKKSKINNIRIISNKHRNLIKAIYSKLYKFDELRPPDPLINRKNIKVKPIKYPSNNPTLIIPNFNYKSMNKTEYFSLDNNLNKTNSINLNKEMQINNYINNSKMINRLIYCKNPKDKDGHVTIENIINLNEISKNERKKEKIKLNLEKNDNKLNDIEKLNNLGLFPSDIINFESNFECGNLQLAYLINSNKENKEKSFFNNNNNDIDHYQLFLQNDTNTTGYSQWFFFRIKNGKKNQKINLSIMNFQRKTTKYSNGIKIWYYSKMKNVEKKISWHHTNENVEYSQNFLYRFIKGKRQYYYTLSFDYTLEYDNDEVYFANCIPYTYSDIINDLNEYTKKENSKYFYFERKKLCTTIIGNDIDYFNINNNIDLINFEANNSKKKGIVLFARQHPGETVGSWVIKGAIDLLMGDSDEAKYLRDNFIIKVIPMINVDGVVCGNSRTSLAGCDLNRRWINPNEYLHPEIFYLKELINNFAKKIKVEYIIDFHGHFGAFNSFFYANNNKEDINFCRKFPFICGKISKIIQLNKSRFKMPKYKRGTGRINLYNELNIENIVTLETSYFGCNEGEYINKYFNADLLKEIGRDICNGILISHYNSYPQKEIKEINNENLDFTTKIKNKLLNINKEFDEYINDLKYKINLRNDNKNNNYNNEEDEEEKIEQLENENGSESDSESEPSRDNLEEEEIKMLLPFFKKKKNVKKNKKNISTFKFSQIIKKNQINIIKNNNNQTPQNKVTNFPKIENSQALISRNGNKIMTINQLLYKNIQKQSISNKFLYKNKIRKFSPPLSINNNTNIHSIITEDKQTQTEEKFFKLHWSNFFGIYKIMSSKYDEKREDKSFSLLSFETKYKENNLRNNDKKFPSTLTSFNRQSKNDSEIIYTNSRNKANVKKMYNSDDNKNYLTKYIKNDNNKYSYSSEQRIKEQKKINYKKERGNSIQKVIKSFISNITSLNKNDFLKRYLNNEDRLYQY